MSRQVHETILFLLPYIAGLVAVAVVLLVMPRRNPGYDLGSRHYKTLIHLVADVSMTIGIDVDGYDSDDYGTFPRLSTARFDGKLPSGRRAKVSFYNETRPYDDRFGHQEATFVRLAVSADAVPDLRVTLEDLASKVQKKLRILTEIEVGDAAFDARYLLETETPDRARKALEKSPEVKHAIEAAFALGARRVAFGAGAVSADFNVAGLELVQYREVLEALDAAARTFDRITLRVKALDGERRAAVDSQGKTRCPYCRAGIVGDEETLIACLGCKTVLHEACWGEHGGCPILGCTGREPERGLPLRRDLPRR